MKWWHGAIAGGVIAFVVVFAARLDAVDSLVKANVADEKTVTSAIANGNSVPALIVGAGLGILATKVL